LVLKNARFVALGIVPFGFGTIPNLRNLKDEISVILGTVPAAVILGTVPVAYGRSARLPALSRPEILAVDSDIEPYMKDVVNDIFFIKHVIERKTTE
jgi:hypothetical protein